MSTTTQPLASHTRPFQLDPQELADHLDEMVEAVFVDLTNQFMLLPRGPAFVTYEEWLAGFEALRLATEGFKLLDVNTCWLAFRNNSTSFLVLRAILGLSPPEWEDLAKEETSAEIPNNWTRSLDGKIKRDTSFFAKSAGQTKVVESRTTALVEAACKAINEGAIEAPEGMVHRLDKIDTQEGLESVRHVAQHHVPYAVLLYERYLGRPFASHRDSVSELVGDVMETAIEDNLTRAGIPFRKTRRAERVAGFDQAPDFFVPDELAPSVIIEAKITGDDGTARDKVARILRLAGMRDQRIREEKSSFEVIACIDGRGFGVRRQDMRDLLVATKGKVFTASSLEQLIEYTDLAKFAP